MRPNIALREKASRSVAQEYREHRRLAKAQWRRILTDNEVPRAHISAMEQQHAARVLLGKKIFLRDAQRDTGLPFDGTFLVHRIAQSRAANDTLVLLSGIPLDEGTPHAPQNIELRITEETYVLYYTENT